MISRWSAARERSRRRSECSREMTTAVTVRGYSTTPVTSTDATRTVFSVATADGAPSTDRQVPAHPALRADARLLAQSGASSGVAVEHAGLGRAPCAHNGLDASPLLAVDQLAQTTMAVRGAVSLCASTGTLPF
jgi:hypothetical protein